MIYLSCKGLDMNSEIYIKGITTINFELALDRTKFVDICENLHLDSDKYQQFTESDWIAIRKHLSTEVIGNATDIEVTEAIEETVFLDQIEFLDDEHYEVMFNLNGDAVKSIEKDSEPQTVKL